MTQEVSHRPEDGVIVAEITRPLRADDFDALAVTADAWTMWARSPGE